MECEKLEKIQKNFVPQYISDFQLKYSLRNWVSDYQFQFDTVLYDIIYGVYFEPWTRQLPFFANFYQTTHIISGKVCSLRQITKRSAEVLRQQ
jgi:hypothetical protein